MSCRISNVNLGPDLMVSGDQKGLLPVSGGASIKILRGKGVGQEKS